jgi:cytochrome c biogenesis protein
VVADTGAGWVSAEKGYLRETGNLLFHLSLLVLLVAVGVGSMLGAKGQVLVREGSSFSNTLTQYDSFSPGRLYGPDRLAPFTLRLDDFRASYQESGMQKGAPREFAADVTVNDGSSPEQSRVIGVNEPLSVSGTRVYLVGHGYAPTFVIRDARGKVVFDDAVVFLPQDGNFTSDGVIKVPDVTPQLGFTGVFLPTAERDAVRGGFSSFPAALRPEVFLSVWRGDLGLDDGTPQSVYRLDTTRMERVGLQSLTPGKSWALPDGLGTLTFTGYKEYATFNIGSDPGSGWALGAAILAIAGLCLSLFVRRRRVWVRVSDEGSFDESSAASGPRVRVEVAGLARTEAPGLDDEVDHVAADIRRRAERS